MGLSTYRHRARIEIEIGTWGSLCSLLLFLICGIAAQFTDRDVTWISGLGCVIGLGTIAAILIRGYLSDATLRGRKALRKLRRY
jgi:hypothetical protein